MDKKIIYIAAIILVLALSLFFLLKQRGPNVPEPAYIVGTIYQVEEGRILVAEEYEEGDEENEGGVRGNAIWANIKESTKIVRGIRSISISGLKVGDNVRLWTEGQISNKYPVEGTALRIVVLRR